jgi:hypothetical protein
MAVGEIDLEWDVEILKSLHAEGQRPYGVLNRHRIQLGVCSQPWFAPERTLKQAFTC